MEIISKKNFRILILTFGVLFLYSCGRYTQNIMFTVDENTNLDSLNVFVEEVNSNYRIAADDYLEVDVYTSNGERLIDPEKKLQVASRIAGQGIEEVKYLVGVTGDVNLPMVGTTNLKGFTMSEADSVLAEKFNVFYEGTFVQTKCVNRRITVLGGNGGQIINLENENTTLLEVLALVGGIDNTSKATNIRLIRGDCVQIIDLTTIDGMRKANLEVQSKDVVYIEPIRKPVLESIKDVTPILSLITSLVTVGFLIISLGK